MTHKLKIFQLNWNAQDEKEWVAAYTNIEALKVYCSITSTDLSDMDDVDEIVEVPESEWESMKITNTDYEESEKDEITFLEWMEGRVIPDIICGTMYE